MNLTVLLIAVYLPLLPVLFLVIRSGAFGKGGFGTFLKLFFLGVAVAVPAFLMEAGGMMAATILLRILFPQAQGGGLLVVSAILRYVLAAALIEEAWKHFILRTTTWKQMTMESIGDGTAASAAVGAGFSAVMYAAWQVAYHFIPTDMEAVRNAMPDFLSAGAVVAFIYALLFVPAHFGYSGFMGMLYGVAKGADQKNHAGRAGFMLTMSFLLPTLLHSLCEGLVGYGMSSGKTLWMIPGFAAEAVLAVIIGIVLSGAHDNAAVANAAAQQAAGQAGAEAAGSETGESTDADGQPMLTMEDPDGGFGAPDADQAGADGGFGAPDAGQASADGGFGAPDADQAGADGGFGAPDADQAGADGGFGAPDADPAGQDPGASSSAGSNPAADPGSSSPDPFDPAGDDSSDHPMLKW